ncbi:hypothetical protein AciPR4_2250 [Terriglobus saanensis SP1PR4]|uniref:DUF1501 domain-containing protein n=1 Tax=Terriglobus saanensis (strain ATCC BAA-1853 / DSM 23119 / SP1PR4) TaxID=401053 RepID=E8UX89_TERSS|nr:hypothetical protein AciPR4_2250 [Terriglobus saanensis SP1PR4]
MLDTKNIRFANLNAARTISATRRDFLRGAIGALSAMSITRAAMSARIGTALPPAQKTILVTFGGGTRDAETFAEEGQENIPNLLRTLLPQGTFFTRVVNAGILGHYVATASVVTGSYERFDNFVAPPPPNPTLFEAYRKGLRRPVTDAWVIAPSNGFQRIGSSSHAAFGPGFESSTTYRTTTNRPRPSIEDRSASLQHGLGVASFCH